MNFNLLELFAGSCSIGKAAKSLNYNVFSTDIDAFEHIDHVSDILQLDTNDVPFIPDVIWASPPCTGFSVAAISHHWDGGKGAYIPGSDTSRLGIRLVLQTLSLIEYYKILNPDLLWYIENPRGVLRKMSFMHDLPIRHTVTYCQYGDNRMKPTDIWTNDYNWEPRPMCKNGDPCHVAAPRGSKTGTQGLKSNHERSKIPQDLCNEVLESALAVLTHNAKLVSLL